MTTWGERHPVLSVEQADELLTRPRAIAADRVQHGLVAITQGLVGPGAPLLGAAEAAYLLLIQMRPGLLRLVSDLRRRPTGRAGFLAIAAEVQSTFFESVYRHNLDRRPARIAANLLLDTRQRVARSANRLPPPRDVAPPEARRAIPLWPAADVTTVTVRAFLASEAASLAGVEQSTNAEIAFRSWFLNERNRDIAADLNLAPGAVAVRLHRMRRRLASELDEGERGQAA